MTKEEMTLDETICHIEKVVEEKLKLYGLCGLDSSHCDGTKDCKVLKNGENKGCLKGAKEHKQLAEWLKELKQLKEQPPCEDCISRKSIKQKLQEHHDFFVNAYGGFSNLPQNDKSRVDEITNCIAMVVNESPITPKGVTVTDFADKCRECGREKVLDKIRAEIEHHRRKTQSIDPYDLVGDCLDIIDKYKAESEDKE